MNKITVLINTALNFEFKNFMILSNALLRTKKFDVFLGLIDSLTMTKEEIECQCLNLKKEINQNDNLKIESFKPHNLKSMDYVWVLSFGKRQSFLDQIQILWILEQKVKLFNSVKSLMFLSNKHWLGHYLDIKHPETYITSDSEYLLDIYDKNKDDTWIIKPTAGSLGREVFKIKPNDCNARVIIQSMTDIKTGKYSIFQKYIAEIRNGEKRILVCNDKIICHYIRKTKGSKDFRTNLHQGATPEICNLTDSEKELCIYIGMKFAKMGAFFIGIDLVYPYVIEVNVLNPGGLNTVYSLTGKDYSDLIIEEIFCAF